MRGRSLLPLLLLAFMVAPAGAGAPLKLSPVLPEVDKQLADGRSDVANNTFPMARAHAQLVLVGSEIKISTLFQSVQASRRATCLHALDAAIEEWEELLGGSVQFVRVPEGQNSNIVVRFRPTVDMKGEQVAGYVNWKRSLERKPDGAVDASFSADLQIRVKDLDGGPMPYNAMRHAAMHEFGHVLGLDDSPHQGDVMGPLDIENPVSAPTQLEVQTVKSLRAAAADIIQKATPAVP